MAGVAHAYVRRPPGNISGVNACMKVKWLVDSHEQKSVICMENGPMVFVNV